MKNIFIQNKKEYIGKKKIDFNNKRKNINDDSFKYKSNFYNSDSYLNLFNIVWCIKSKNWRKNKNLGTNNTILFLLWIYIIIKLLNSILS
jgi:hypothetical protein